MRVKVAEIVIKGDGANVMDLRSKIVGALEKGSERDKYDTQIKLKRDKKGFVVQEKVKVFLVN